MRGMFGKGLTAFNVLVYAFLLAPLAVVAVSSFGATSYLRFPPQGLTFRWFIEALDSPVYWATFRVSVWVATVSGIAATLIGIAAAYALGRYRPAGRNALSAFFLSPLIMPSLVLGVALLVFSSTVWAPPGIWRLVVGHVVITIPYVVRTTLPVIEQLDPALEEAATDLGAKPWTAVRTVNLPLLLPAIVVSAGLAFLISFDELVLALFLAPPSAPTLPLQIYSNVQFGLDPTVGAVSVLLLVLTGALMLTGQAVMAARRRLIS